MSGRRRWRVTIPFVAASTASTLRTGTRFQTLTACAVTPTAFARADGPPTTRIACSSAVSLFLGMDGIKALLAPQVKHCLTDLAHKDNPHVPYKKRPTDNPSGASRLAQRIKDAMDKRDPKITSMEVARACKVTPQAVHGWRTNGRVAKHHLLTLADLTDKDPTYFLSIDPLPRNGASAHTEGFQILQRAWDTASQDQKEILLGVAKGILNAHRSNRAGKA